MLFHIESPKDTTKKKKVGVLTDGQVVGNLPGNAGDTGSIPDERTKIPHAATIDAHMLWSLGATSRKLVYQNKSFARHSEDPTYYNQDLILPSIYFFNVSEKGDNPIYKLYSKKNTSVQSLSYV